MSITVTEENIRLCADGRVTLETEDTETDIGSWFRSDMPAIFPHFAHIGPYEEFVFAHSTLALTIRIAAFAESSSI